MGPFDGPTRDEHFPFRATREQGGSVLPQRLHDEGLLFAVNALVLHDLGLALGITAGSLDPATMKAERVSGLTLHATEDPEGFEFGEAAFDRAQAKLRAAGHDVLADRIQMRRVIRQRPSDA